MPSLPFRDQPLIHDFVMQSDPPRSSAIITQGVQSITPAGATLTLTTGETGANEDRLTNNIVRIAPDADGRIVKLPAVAEWKGVDLRIENTHASNSLVIQTSAAAAVVTISAGQYAVITCDGTKIRAINDMVTVTIRKSPAETADICFYIAQRPMEVVSMSFRPNVLQGGAATALIKKAASTTAPGSGTSLHQSGSFDLNAGLHTTQAGVVSTTLATRSLAAGDGLCVDFAGSYTTADGVFVVNMRPL